MLPARRHVSGEGLASKIGQQLCNMHVPNAAVKIHLVRTSTDANAAIRILQSNARGSQGKGLGMQDERAVTQLVKLSVVGRCVDYLRSAEPQHQGLLAMLLSNVTLSKSGASSLLQLSSPQLQGYHMCVLL